MNPFEQGTIPPEFGERLSGLSGTFKSLSSIFEKITGSSEEFDSILRRLQEKQLSGKLTNKELLKQLDQEIKLKKDLFEGNNRNYELARQQLSQLEEQRIESEGSDIERAGLSIKNKMKDFEKKATGVVTKGMTDFQNVFSGSAQNMFSSVAGYAGKASSSIGTGIEYVGKGIQKATENLGPKVAIIGKVIGKAVEVVGKFLAALGTIAGTYLQIAVGVLMKLADYQNRVSEANSKFQRLIDPRQSTNAQINSYTNSLRDGFYRAAKNAGGLTMALNGLDRAAIAAKFATAGFTNTKEIGGGALGIMEVASRSYFSVVGGAEEMFRTITRFSSESASKVAENVMVSMGKLTDLGTKSGISQKVIVESYASMAKEAFQYGVDEISVAAIQGNIMKLDKNLKSAGVDLNKSLKTILTDMVTSFSKWSDGLKGYLGMKITGAGDPFSAMIQTRFGKGAQYVEGPDGTRSIQGGTQDKTELAFSRISGIKDFMENATAGITDLATKRFAFDKLNKDMGLGLSDETVEALFVGGDKLSDPKILAELKNAGISDQQARVRLVTEAERSNAIAEAMLRLQIAAFSLITNILNYLLLGIMRLVNIWSVGNAGIGESKFDSLLDLNNRNLVANFGILGKEFENVASMTGIKSAAASIPALGLTRGIVDSNYEVPTSLINKIMQEDKISSLKEDYNNASKDLQKAIMSGDKEQIYYQRKQLETLEKMLNTPLSPSKNKNSSMVKASN